MVLSEAEKFKYQTVVLGQTMVLQSESKSSRFKDTGTMNPDPRAGENNSTQAARPRGRT